MKCALFLTLLLIAAPAMASGSRNNDDRQEQEQGQHQSLTARIKNVFAPRTHANGGDAEATARAEASSKSGARSSTGDQVLVIEGSRDVVHGDDYEAPAPAPAPAYAESRCNTSSASATGTGGGISIGVSSYACDVEEIHDALLKLESGHCVTRDATGACSHLVEHGFFDGTVPAFFLKAQLTTKGLAKTIWPF